MGIISGTVQRVGTSGGVQELTLRPPAADPGKHFINSFMTEPSQTWTNALAWSATREIIVLPRG